MIVKELYKTRADGVKLFRTYSDAGKDLIQNETGIIYSEAIDVENAPYTYDEYRDIPEVITEDLAFAKGEKGGWEGAIYESVYDGANTWNPAQLPAGWKMVGKKS